MTSRTMWSVLTDGRTQDHSRATAAMWCASLMWVNNRCVYWKIHTAWSDGKMRHVWSGLLMFLSFSAAAGTVSYWPGFPCPESQIWLNDTVAASEHVELLVDSRQCAPLDNKLEDESDSTSSLNHFHPSIHLLFLSCTQGAGAGPRHLRVKVVSHPGQVTRKTDNHLHSHSYTHTKRQFKGAS